MLTAGVHPQPPNNGRTPLSECQRRRVLVSWVASPTEATCANTYNKCLTKSSHIPATSPARRQQRPSHHNRPHRLLLHRKCRMRRQWEDQTSRALFTTGHGDCSSSSSNSSSSSSSSSSSTSEPQPKPQPQPTPAKPKPKPKPKPRVKVGIVNTKVGRAGQIFSLTPAKQLQCKQTSQLVVGSRKRAHTTPRSHTTTQGVHSLCTYASSPPKRQIPIGPLPPSPVVPLPQGALMDDAQYIL